jgi:predicted metal-dependent peptidase
MYIDTSGSISYRELNEFLDIVDGFLKQGTKTCTLNLWHTDLYYSKKYKLKNRLKQADLESGGTDPDPVLDKIAKDRPELAIILTDGYYSGYRGSVKKLNGIDIIWIISEGGSMDHSNKDIGKTIPMKGIK